MHMRRSALLSVSSRVIHLKWSDGTPCPSTKDTCALVRPVDLLPKPERGRSHVSPTWLSDAHLATSETLGISKYDASAQRAYFPGWRVQNAPKKFVRAQIIKLADKISNLRSILSSPPAHWDYERKKQYFEWAKQVVDALSAPNAALKVEFETTYQRFDDTVER
jgi:hypothetical protein